MIRMRRCILPIVLQRGGRGLEGIIINLVALVVTLVVGCGGPIDSRPPRMTAQDAGTDIRRTVDAARDLPKRPDAITIVDTGVSVPWPVIPGCVSGLPPSPQFTPSTIPTVTISCAAGSPVLLHLTDAAGQGMIFDTTLDPPISGFSSTHGSTVCASNGNTYPTPIELFVSQAAALPGSTFSTTLRITLQGPSQPGYTFPLRVTTAPIDFTLDPAVIDFGTVYLGTAAQASVTVTNALDGAPFENLYATQPQQGTFSLFASGMTGTSLQPGDSQPMLQAYLNAQTLGTFETTFLVSPFLPGVPIDPSCGVIRTLTMRAQVVAPGKGPPPPLPDAGP